MDPVVELLLVPLQGSESVPVLASQSRAVLSKEAVTTRAPSGLNAAPEQTSVPREGG